MNPSESIDQPSANSRLSHWTGLACDAAGLMLAAMALMVIVEIVMRGVIGKSILIADEYSGYLFVWITMIGFAYALQLGAFLRVDNFVGRMGPTGKALTDMLSALTGVVVSMICTYGTGTLVLASMRFGTVSIQPSATPLWIPQVILPLGFLGLTGIYLALLHGAWTRFRLRSE